MRKSDRQKWLKNRLASLRDSIIGQLQFVLNRAMLQFTEGLKEYNTSGSSLMF